MNARQTKKHLKKQIRKLKSDNELMNSIITNSPTMQELYDLYKKPVFITHATMQFQEYRAKTRIPFQLAERDEVVESEKHLLAAKLLDEFEKDIIYEFDYMDMPVTITASIFVGRK